MIRDIHTIHFSGICGTAMASCAAELKRQGYHITGSDEGVYPPMSAFLDSHGIQISSPYDASHLAHQPDLVVIGNALSRGNVEVEYILEKRLPFCSLPELLKTFFICKKRSIVISGTHGKTTTASLAAWIFEKGGRVPSFLIGGIPINFGFGSRLTKSPWIILEGDEYDCAFFDKRSKFIHYLPEIAILNNLEFDHADMFKDLAAIQLSFQHFIDLIPRNGLLLINGDDANLHSLSQKAHCQIQTFGFGNGNDISASKIEMNEMGSHFEVCEIPFWLPLTGEFNIRNALAAIACAQHCGLSNADIQQALTSFRGIRRRMETRTIEKRIGGKSETTILVDDFGHHPTAIGETIRALRAAYPDRRLWVAFEPRSNSTRSKVFQSELAVALSQSDVVLISQVARFGELKKSQRLDPEQLVSDIQSFGRDAFYLEDANSICLHLSRHFSDGDVICIFSNGSFDDLCNKIEQTLKSRS